MVIYLHTRITLLKIDSIRYFVSLFMKYKKSLAGYLFIGKMLLRHNKNALHLFIYNFYICIFLVFYNIYIFNFFIVSLILLCQLLKTSSGISVSYANFLTTKTIDIRMTLEIYNFREQSNFATHTVNMFPIVAHKKYWRWTIR